MCHPLNFILKKGYSFSSTGTSMAPLLLPKDKLYISKIKFSKVLVNDLVLVNKRSTFFSHRVILKTKKYLVTKGDNNLLCDGKIYPKHVLGKVYKAKKNGEMFNLENLYLLQSTIYLQEIIKIKRNFDEKKINYTFLKGLPLHLHYEKTHPRRLYLDCDVLIGQKDFLKAEKILIKNGYKKEKMALSKTHEKIKNKDVENAYTKIVGGFPVVFDLHLEPAFMMTQLGRLDALYPQKNIDQLTKEFLDTKRKIKINNDFFFILNTEYLILYLVLHLFHHNFRGAFRYDFLDKVIRTVKIHPGGEIWPNIASKINDFQLNNFVYPVFILLKKYYKTPIPRSFLKSIQPSSFYLHYLSSSFKTPFSIFDDQPRVKAGITRFKNLYFLSPEPWWKKIWVFFNPQVIYSVFWVFYRKMKGFFSFLNQKQDH